MYKYDKNKIHIEDYLFLIVSFILITFYSSIYFKDHYYHGEIFGDDIPDNYHTIIRGKENIWSPDVDLILQPNDQIILYGPLESMRSHIEGNDESSAALS